MLFFLLLFHAFSFTVSPTEINATLPFPLEGCLIAHLQVCSDEETEIFVDMEGKNKDWLVILPTGAIPVENCTDMVFTV